MIAYRLTVRFQQTEGSNLILADLFISGPLVQNKLLYWIVEECLWDHIYMYLEEHIQKVKILAKMGGFPKNISAF